MRIRCGYWGVALLVAITSHALALGTEEFGNKPLDVGNYPPKLAPVVNDTSRVYQSWVNGHELFYYRGDNVALRAFLEKFAATDAPQRRLILRPGRGHTTSFHDKPVEFDWSMELVDGVARQMLMKDKGNQIWPEHPTATIYTDAVKLDDLKVPSGVTLVGIDELKKSAIPAIEASPSNTVRGWGCGVLANLDKFDPEIIAAIAGRLDDQDDWVKLNAVGAMAGFGARAGEYALKLRELADTTADEKLKQGIAEALKEIASSSVESETEVLQHQLQLRRIRSFIEQN